MPAVRTREPAGARLRNEARKVFTRLGDRISIAELDQLEGSAAVSTATTA